MGVDLLEITVKMRKAVIFHIKVCYRTLWDHPFLVGMFFFLSVLYRSFPFAFSILLSVSPILVCTAALLGTLLSYGQPNIPEFEWEESTTDHIVPLETRDATRVEGGNSYFAERYTTDQERDKVDKSKLSEVHRDKRFGDHSALVGGVLVGGISAQVAREFYDKKNEEKISDAELMENQYSPTSKVDDESVEFDNDKSVDSFDSRRVNLDSPPGSPWKHREEEYDKALYSGSDQAESSSPDASIADIMPMLDELHPLLDEDTPLPIGLSRDVSHAPSESSSKFSESDDESDDVSEDQEELEVADDENEDEEETQDKEDPKSAITWTEEDQRNLMDLGTSELERNQRLESLIARRRSRKNMGFIDEKNLIDLVTADYMPPISTARQNPFDLPNDNYAPGLPPIPGSAPSILLPRRNPFDLPYDPSEEKPDLTGDTFQQEIIPSQPKEPFFRRHESFSVGPSIFGLHKQDRKDTRFRPYFVPDVMASEGASYSPFQSLPSDVSDSKGSIEDLEDNNLTDEDVEDKNLNEELDGKHLTDEHIFKEPQLISMIEHASEDVGHGSPSSEEVECLVLGASDKRDIELDDSDVKLQNHHEVIPIVFHEKTVVSSSELDQSKIYSKSTASEQKYSSQSSSSSSSEVSERIFADKVVVRLSSEEAICHVETISEKPTLNMSDLNITSSSVDESSHLEPIYDASPPSIKKNSSSSSITSDVLLESEMGLATEREFVQNNQNIEKSIPNKEQIFSSANSQKLRLRETVANKNELGVAKFDISEHDEVSGSATAPPVPLADGQTYIDSKSSTKEAPASMEEARTMESLNVSKIQEVPPNINSPRSPESVLKPPNAKVETEESESSKNATVHKVSSSKDHEKELPTLEARSTGDTDLIHKHLPEDNADRDIFYDSVDEDEHAREFKGKGASLHSQNVGTDSAMKQVLKNDIDKPNTSFQQESKTESCEASSSKNLESNLKEVIVSERSEADTRKIDKKVVKQEAKATTTEKPDHVVELPQETGVVAGDIKGKKENHTSGSS